MPENKQSVQLKGTLTKPHYPIHNTMITEHHINIQKTARYFTYGHLNRQTTHVWFVLHGYGHLAADFIGNFSALNPAKHYVIAPEALSRFYWNGYRGKISASWMTSEDRLQEITDYVAYLNQLYLEITQNLPDECMPEINLLGFSQGTTTLSRWFANGKVKANKVIFWSGDLGHDVDWNKAADLYHQTNAYYVYGTNDELISLENFKLQSDFLNHHQIPFTTIEFDGKHVISEDVLLKHFVPTL
jgi:predicted esterase